MSTPSDTPTPRTDSMMEAARPVSREACGEQRVQPTRHPMTAVEKTLATEDVRPCGLAVTAGWPRHAATDKSVREITVTAKLVAGDVRVECKRAGIIFGFPRAVWPSDSWTQAQWIERLTPWWDMACPDWSPQAQRLRDSCRAAINRLSAPVQNLGRTPTVNAPQGVARKGDGAAASSDAAGKCTGADSLSSANACDELRPGGSAEGC